MFYSKKSKIGKIPIKINSSNDIPVKISRPIGATIQQDAKTRANEKYLSNKKSFTTYVNASVGNEMTDFCTRTGMSKKQFVEESAKHMIDNSGIVAVYNKKF